MDKEDLVLKEEIEKNSFKNVDTDKVIENEADFKTKMIQNEPWTSKSFEYGSEIESIKNDHGTKKSFGNFARWHCSFQ